MITERTALLMLDGRVPHDPKDPHHSNQYYRSMKIFADVSLKVCEEKNFKRLEKLMGLACTLLKEGNDTVKNGVLNVYLFTLSHAFDDQPIARKWLDQFMPPDLKMEYVRLHYVGGL